jgi:hypothetical protein
MDVLAKRSELKDRFDESRFQFIMSELELAITFCRVAATSSSNTKSDRNAQNAQKAYRAARHFLVESDLSKSERQNVHDKVKQLNVSLKQLRHRPRGERKPLLR